MAIEPRQYQHPDEWQATATAAVGAIRDAWPVQPAAAIVLGTGLGTFADHIDIQYEMDFSCLPGFVSTTAMGHKGRLLAGTVQGVPLIAMEGRNHFYEGCTMQQLAFPVHLVKRLGVELLILSNASGGVHPRLAQGDVVVIEDHINLMWNNPLIGPYNKRTGPRFLDMSAPYDPAMIEHARQIARAGQFTAQVGVYAAMTGPNYETRAEYRFLRRIGADVVGMSTVPEVLAANQVGLPVLALSAVTNVCRPDCLTPTDGQAVIAAAQSTADKMRAIVTGVLKRWSST